MAFRFTDVAGAGFVGIQEAGLWRDMIVAGGSGFSGARGFGFDSVFDATAGTAAGLPTGATGVGLWSAASDLDDGSCGSTASRSSFLTEASADLPALSRISEGEGVSAVGVD